VKPATVGTLLFVIVFFPSNVVDLVTALRKELVEHLVGSRCARHTCYGIAHQHIELSVLRNVATYHGIDAGEKALPLGLAG